jgi:hypothetical protein
MWRCFSLQDSSFDFLPGQQVFTANRMRVRTNNDKPVPFSCLRRKGVAFAMSPLFFLMFPLLLHGQQDTMPSSRLAFISDTQAPRWIDEVLLTSNRNVEATRLLVDDIVHQKPSSLYLLGDVVNLSRSDIHWEFMDSCLSVLHSAGIPTEACLGNHELMGNAKEGEKKFQVRFPGHVNTGYTVIRDSIATVFLNSNFSKMTAQQILKQDEWYKKELDSLDNNPGIRVIIVGCHHPPYSDSEMVGSNANSREHFLPAFSKSVKSKLFLSGHAHVFEHFNYQGKDLMVIGGGGGLRHPLKKKSCGLTDLAGKYKPEFHYLVIERYPEKLKIISRRLKTDFSTVEDGSSFEIRLNP